MGHDILGVIFVSLGLAGWFIAGDLLFPEVTLGKVGFTLVPAGMAFVFWKWEKKQ